jgi:hypothetical protein
MLPAVAQFKGEVPRVAFRKLPPEFAATAINCRLLSGDLEAFRNFDAEVALTKAAEIVTIFPLDNGAGSTAWLSWSQSELAPGAVEVDVAKSVTADDTRIFLTGLDVPRWTDYSLATTGAGAPPITTRPLGVPGPGLAPTVNATAGLVPTIDIFDDLSPLSQSQWVLVPTFIGPFAIRKAEFLTLSPDETARLWLTAQEITTSGAGPVYAYRDFGIGDSAQIEYSFDWTLEQAHAPYGEFTATVMVANSEGGAGPVFSWGTNGAFQWVAGYGLHTSWTTGATLGLVPTGFAPTYGAIYRVKVVGSQRSNGNYDFVFSISLGSTPVFELSFDNIPISGGFCGHGIYGSLNADRGPIIQTVDRIVCQASAPVDDGSDDVATNYVYTFVNDRGEESAPSEPSATVLKDDSTTVTITTSTSPPTGLDYFITTKRIYRAATGGAGTTYRFVAEIPLAQVDYTDTLTDLQLGEDLESADWDLPPSNLRGILALPNGIYVGFFDNTLCLSAQNRPHAWPVRFRLATDERIVAIGNVDTVVTIATEEFPYTASGTAPDTYSMTKTEVKQGCASKRGCAYLKGLGWIYPSPDGLVAIAGVGQVQLLTSGLMTRRDWQALNPATLIADVHDNRYFGFYVDCALNERGILIDPAEASFGKVTLGFHASAMFSWAKTDTLYLVLDVNAPPEIGSPSGVGQVIPNGVTVYAFDSYCAPGALTPLLPRSWLSKKYQMQGDIPRYCRILATDYDDVKLALYSAGSVYYIAQVTGPDPFTLPKDYPIHDFFQYEVLGTSFVQSVQFAYDADEFNEGG